MPRAERREKEPAAQRTMPRGSGMKSTVHIFGDSHDPGAFASTATKTYRNWHPEKPRLVSRNEMMGPPGLSHDGYYAHGARPDPFAAPKNLVPQRHLVEFRDVRQESQERSRAPRGGADSGLRQVLQHSEGQAPVHPSSHFVSAYKAFNLSGRKPLAAAALTWKPAPPRYDLLTGGEPKWAEAAFEHADAPSQRVSANRHEAQEQRSGRLPPVNLLGMPRDGNLEFRGKKRAPRQPVELSAPSVPAYMVAAT
eukprot:TRINITY_DN7557_c0_g1_i1.p1 TRINITY_DN7557_c0_g1~~TRINITY_DN7557_c0_g1_i1.p1  ORF type:complete len:252 (+),score=55.61 TRINITY_DN7557_c0_g1_i1:40-795(+)